LLGTVLGAIDGLSAWFTPAVRAQIVGIVVGSTINLHYSRKWNAEQFF